MFFKKQHIVKPTPSWKQLPDQDLIEMYQDSEDLEYLTELFERYTHLIFAICMKYLKNEELCKDAVMSIFEELIVKAKKHQIENFKSWIYSLTKNYCLMKLRKHKQFERYSKQNGSSFEEENSHSIFNLHQIEQREYSEQMSDLNQAIKSLKKEQELCVRLFYLEEKSYKEVEQLTGYSNKQVKSYIQNGKRNLKLYLESNGRSK